MLDEDEQSSAPDVLVVKTELSMGWTYFYLTSAWRHSSSLAMGSIR